MTFWLAQEPGMEPEEVLERLSEEEAQADVVELLRTLLTGAIGPSRSAVRQFPPDDPPAISV
ncbi:hypothetical protein AB0940_24615 [Streptomyces sp. NPDC006656]|uniref:hypothetical protein n=1 Tax=Streptomyces sp. NPDC006656 TaxID=3156899 RepID=UPI00345147C9